MKERAFFVFRPRTVSDLSIGTTGGKWRECRIVKTVRLSRMDYENFTTDLLVDRQFIEDSAPLCTAPGDCLLITGKQQQQELLVIPWQGCFVRHAALRPAIHLLDEN
jgi:hypothetical protein